MLLEKSEQGPSFPCTKCPDNNEGKASLVSQAWQSVLKDCAVCFVMNVDQLLKYICDICVFIVQVVSQCDTESVTSCKEDWPQ